MWRTPKLCCCYYVVNNKQKHKGRQNTTSTTHSQTAVMTTTIVRKGRHISIGVHYRHYRAGIDSVLREETVLFFFGRARAAYWEHERTASGGCGRDDNDCVWWLHNLCSGQRANRVQHMCVQGRCLLGLSIVWLLGKFGPWFTSIALNLRWVVVTNIRLLFFNYTSSYILELPHLVQRASTLRFHTARFYRY